ncbi:hypothetical protein [Pseudomonas putida]|uniref:DUF2513 domain-containing protein n=1 Tax=Pseudomonas putida TaxID=303 RepID=A0A8I1E9P6_PSEPU|nr:hypothetical protein [Pseudomonas putida]MBI6882374.1 hypothetical protein [Pseudomonas putida]
MRFKKEVAAAILRKVLESNVKEVVRSVEGVSVEDFQFHCQMLSDMGVLNGAQEWGEEGKIFSIFRITWFGYTKLYIFSESLGKEYDPTMFARNF